MVGKKKLLNGIKKSLETNYERKKMSNNNYIQIQAGDGRAASWSGSGRKIQDISYPQGHKDVFTGESLPALNLKQDLEVKLAEQIQEVRDGKRSWDEVGSSLLRYFNN